MMSKKFYLYDRFFESNQSFTTEHVKIVKIPGFFSDFCLEFQVFFKVSQIPGYFCLNCRIPGKKATLCYTEIYYLCIAY